MCWAQPYHSEKVLIISQKWNDSKQVHNKSSVHTFLPTSSPPTISLKWTTFQRLYLHKTYSLFLKQNRLKFIRKKGEKVEPYSKLYLWPFCVFPHREYLQSRSHASLQLLGEESPGEIIWIDTQKISACLQSSPLYFARSPCHVWGNMQSKKKTHGEKGSTERGEKKRHCSYFR